VNTLKMWLLLALAFFCPHADPGDDPPVDDDPPADDPSADDDHPADDPPPDDDPAPPDPAAARLEAAERAAREAQDAVQALQRQTQAKPDPTLDEEERKLRDPATTPLERWQIESNRALRASQHQSQAALFQAQDVADRTSYQVKAASNPLYGKYQDRVEAELAKARAAGANPGREFLLDVLIGRDMRLGNFKAKQPAAKSIPRGKPNSARSDTPRNSSMTDRQKRAARLQDVQI